MLYRLCPTLIREGYVYIAEPPLFEITCKEKNWFAYSEKEKADILKSLEGKKAVSYTHLDVYKRQDVGSERSAASGRSSEVSEWPRSKFPVSAVRQRRNFGHRNRDIRKMCIRDSLIS